MLESNLLGIGLMTDKNVKRKGFIDESLLTFLEVLMPSKTHL